MMERRRRARINNCLTQLKSLLIQDMKKDNSHISKLEKAEILELTVRKLKKLQELINPDDNAGYHDHPRYRDGFNDCIGEVVDYFGKKDCINTDFRSRVISHLNNCYNNRSKTPNQEITNRLEKAEVKTQKTHQVSVSVDCKTLKGLSFNHSVPVSNEARDGHPRPLCVVNGQPSPSGTVQAVSIDPQQIAGHRSVQFHTNNHQQTIYDLSQKHLEHNETKLADIPSSTTSTIVRNLPTAVDIAELIRNGNQITGVDTNNGMPIAFLVTTPLAIKAIPLYTSVDQSQRLATLSPTGTVIATPSSSPVGGLLRTPQEGNADSFEMKVDGNMSDSAYSTTDEGALPNVSIQNVWRPWNTHEN